LKSLAVTEVVILKNNKTSGAKDSSGKEQGSTLF
jgi:hypothetical protein